jgi:hypothetical protein
MTKKIKRLDNVVIIQGYWRKTSKDPCLRITIESDEFGTNWTAGIERDIIGGVYGETIRDLEKLEVLVE